MRLPKGFIDSVKELLGEEYEAYLQSYQAPKVQGLRVNTAKISVSEFQKITPFSLTPIPWTENGFYYEEGETVTKHPHYFAGLYYIQEPSAMIPASRLPITPGERVLDLCAAPGGKATELGAKLKGEGLLVANDISNSRAKALLKNLELFGIENLLVTSEPPEKLAGVFAGYFDKILIDAPCSGEGMFRKDPAMIRSWEKHGPDYYSQIQREILKVAVQMLRPGGMLLYSTCTFSEKENEDSIRFLLEEEPDMRLVPAESWEGFAEGSLSGTLRVWPHRVKGEGHFAALLQKQDGGSKELPWAVQKKEKLPKELEEFIKQIPRLYKKRANIFLREGKAYLMPEELPSLRGLRFLRTGLYLGECRKNRFEPSQALAMALKPEDFPRTLSMETEDGRVLRYLKGETIDLADEEEQKGWVLVCVDGYPLGWGKAAGGRLKNKYYPGWRLQ